MRPVTPAPRSLRSCAGAAAAVTVLGVLAAPAAQAATPSLRSGAAVAGTTSAPGPDWIHPGTTRWSPRRTGAYATGRAAAAAARVTVPPALLTYLREDRGDLQWALRAANVRQAWQASRGDGVVVATIDTGVDATAPDLAGRLLTGGYLGPSGTIVAGTPADRVGHGTHVATVVVGNDDGHGVTGVAPGAKLLPVNVLPSGDLPPTGAQVASAITWAAARGARVINLSVGFEDLPTSTADVAAICKAVGTVVAANVVVVAAAGNDGEDVNARKAPAGCPGVISVSALDGELRPAPWSSYDGSVTVAAPGVSIWSTVPTTVSPLRYSAESGTSMAAPFVAGVAALVVAQHPDWTPAQVSARIASTARDVAPAGRDPRTGAGAVDAAAAVGLASDGPREQPILAFRADPYASRVDSSGFGVFDKTEVHWVPDPSFAATGYRVTRWTTSGTTTTTYDADTVRAVFPSGQAGYQVTALGADGAEVAAAPRWFPLAGQDFTPIYPVTGLRATWARGGAVTLRWTNPARNRDLADQFAVLMNGEVVLSGEAATLPTSVTVPASRVPAGDVDVSVIVGSSTSNDIEETRVTLAARVPFSGTAVRAGKGVYRLDLLLAPSRRKDCGGSRCTGAPVSVTVDGRSTTSRLDARGHAVFLVRAGTRGGKVKVSVTMSRKARLTDRALLVPVG